MSERDPIGRRPATREEIAEALEEHARAVAEWGGVVTGMLQRAGEQAAELERRVSRIEKRMQALERRLVRG